MTARRYLKVAGWMVTLIAGVGIGVAIGQQSQQNGPTETRGMEAKVMSTVDLAPDLPGHQLRIRTITLAPDGVVAVHSHKDRPAFAYILEGTLTEGRPGGYSKDYKPGDVLTESRDVTHWAENRGKTPLKIVGIDVFKP